MEKMQPVRGTYDLLGQELQKFRALEKLAYETTSLYGYEQIVTPIFEYTQVFTKPLGETSDIVGKEMYTFQNKGNESITLRPEGTAPVLRAIMSEGLTQTLPQRRITIGPFFRHERPQKGRCRQFHQISVECVGIESFHADIEVICLGADILKKAGVRDVTLHINTLGCSQSRRQYKEALVAYLTKHKQTLSPESQRRLETNPLRILDSKLKQDREICKNAPKIQDHLTEEATVFFTNICTALTALDINYIIDPTLVRGMDYYCHTVFEFKSTQLGAQDTVLGGGRYDGLMKQMGGPDTPAVGFACGIERVLLLTNQLAVAQQNPKVCFLPLEDHDALHTQKIIKQLRANNIYCEMLWPGKLSKRLAQAVKKQAEYTCVVGETERLDGNYSFRNLQKEQGTELKETTVSIDEMITLLKEAPKT